MKILLVGRTEILYDTAVALNKQHTITGIITAPASPEYLRTEKDFQDFADSIGCPCVVAKSLRKDDVKSMLETISADIVISMNWVSIIDDAFISRFRLGVLNAHFGDLPRYRGNAVTNWAMIAGESEVVLTVHFMQGGELDSGDIVLQERMKLTDQTTIADINAYAAGKIPQLFAEAATRLDNGTLRPMPQSETGLTPFRCYPRLPRDSRINWNMSAADIDVLVRASTHPYSGAYSYLTRSGELKKLYVWKSRVVETETVDVGTPGHLVKHDKETGESWVYTGGGILALCEVSFDDEEPFRPGSVWKSIRTRFEIDVEDHLIALKKELSELKDLITARKS